VTAAGVRPDLRELSDHVAGRRDRMLADLVAYAGHETPSDDLGLLATGLTWVESWLGDVVGAPSSRTVQPGGDHGDTVTLEYRAARASADSVPWVTVLCHYDTVWSAGTLETWPVVVDGDRVTGPGVFDMKAGLVQFAHALASVDALGAERPHVRLVLNGDEEIGSPSSRGAIEDAVRKGGPVFVPESAAGGAVKTARKGVGLFTVEAFGVEVHAGLDPRAGASAVDEIARVVLQLHGAADLDAGTSVNVGVVHAGTRSNVRAGHARASVDVRVTSAAESARIDGVLAALHAHDPLARLEVSGGWNRPVMERSEATASLYRTAASVADGLGHELRETSVGGASDGNFAAALGHAVLDGIGAVGDGAHARHEWASVSGMVERSAVVAALLTELAAPR
jgi:glutamate carboxypeptidase